MPGVPRHSAGTGGEDGPAHAVGASFALTMGDMSEVQMPARVKGLDLETKSIIESTLVRFVEESYDPHARRMRLKADSVDYRLHWGLLAELGVLGMPFGEAQGGMSGSAVDVADVVRVLARGLVLEPFVESAVIAGQLLGAATAQPGQTNQLSALIAGETVTALIGGRAGLTDTLVARKAVEGWYLDGTVRAVMYAAQADQWLVAAQEAASGQPLVFCVRRDDVAAQVDAFRLLDGRSAADVTFADAAVAQQSLYLNGHVATVALERASYHATSAYCADAVGCMAQLVAITRDYLRTRVQFGVAIGTFQALQHRFADMHMAYLEARAIARALAGSLDEDVPLRQRWLRFAAASVITSASARIGPEAIQMHGGVGLTDELIVSHYNARLLTLARLLRNMVPQDLTLPPLSSARAWL